MASWTQDPDSEPWFQANMTYCLCYATEKLPPRQERQVPEYIQRDQWLSHRRLSARHTRSPYTTDRPKQGSELKNSVSVKCGATVQRRPTFCCIGPSRLHMELLVLTHGTTSTDRQYLPKSKTDAHHCAAKTNEETES